MTKNSTDATYDAATLPTFVLSGGGNLGALQIGMAYALVESGIRPGMIVGTSIGAINGAFLATRSDLNGVGEIAQFWVSLRRRDILQLSALTLARGIFRVDHHFFDSKPIRKVIESFLTFDRIEKSPIPFAVVATALSSGEPVILNSGDAVTAVLASSAVPHVLPPVKVDGRLLVDGAAVADIPLLQAESLGARAMYVLPTALAEIAKVRHQDPPDGKGPDRHIVMPPDVHVPLGDLSQSKRLLHLGYEHTRSWLEESRS